MIIRKVFTERAHLMCPSMHFGIAAAIARPFDETRIFEALEKLRACHPLLSSIISFEADGTPVYEKKADLAVPVHFMKDASSFLKEYEEITAAGWDVRTDCLLRFIACPDEEKTFVVFAVHHLLCDGKALLNLVEEFADVYTGNADCTKKEDKLILSPDDFDGRLQVPFMLSGISSSANRKWAKEKRSVTYEQYRAFEKEYYREARFERTASSATEDELQGIIDACHLLKVTVNDYLIAKMMVEENTRKVLVGVDIRKYLKNHEDGAVGNFSSAYSVELHHTDDVWLTAEKVSKAIAKIKKNPARELLTLALYTSLDQNLLDASAITSLGGFESKAALFIGDRLLGFRNAENHTITNLGKLESNIISDAWFIPPCSPSAKVIAGVITVNGVMNTVTCTRKRV